MSEEVNVFEMAENMSDDDTSYELSNGGYDKSEDDTSNDNAKEDEFYSDDDFESNAHFDFEEKYKC